ncbi:MAG: hypothetical protein NZM26_04985, partial [Patescibacteria group bacterium]|nr:hypothetical protein [Patescibacteria group bacterium]
MSTESEIGYLKQHISNSEEPKTQAERIKKYVREVPEERRAEIQELFASLDKETIEAAEFLSTACRSILFSFDDSFVKSMEVKEEIFEILLEKGV